MMNATLPNPADQLTVGIAQIAPVWLDRESTVAKICDYVGKAANAGCQLVAYGEALIPGYPFWVERTDGARFNSPTQKELHAHYGQQAVQIEAGHLDLVRAAASRHNIAVIVGCVERPADRGGHSLYCSLVFMDACGTIQSVHRKLVPTYEERLTWAPGDGHGLRVHAHGRFTIGALNCWENWMPLARAALHAQGEDLHVAVWPGGLHNTHDITRFIAKESRSFVVSACGLLRCAEIPSGVPHRDRMLADHTEYFANGGSCLAGPDGEWIKSRCGEGLMTEEALHFVPIDLGEPADLSVAFRLDSYFCSFGAADKFYVDYTSEQGCLDWLRNRMHELPGSCVHLCRGAQIIGQLEMGRSRAGPEIGYVNLYCLVAEARGSGAGERLDEYVRGFMATWASHGHGST
jgi:nitrilase